jgi:hypothetical protein
VGRSYSRAKINSKHKLQTLVGSSETFFGACSLHLAKNEARILSVQVYSWWDWPRRPRPKVYFTAQPWTMSSGPVRACLYVSACFCVCVSCKGTRHTTGPFHVHGAVKILWSNKQVQDPKTGLSWSAQDCIATGRLAHDRLTSWSRDFLHKLLQGGSNMTGTICV